MRSRHSRRSLLSAMGAAAIGLSFSAAGCSKPGAGAASSSAAGPAEEPKLNFYNWDEYIGETTFDDFKAATGIEVTQSLFESNDELFAKLRAGNPGFDLIVPTNDYIPRLRDANLIVPLDHSKIPNMVNIDPSFMNPVYDPGRKYSMPYTWLVLGLGFRKSKMQPGHIPDSWSYVFEPTMYKKRLTILGDSADMIRLAGKYLGYSINNIPDDGLVKIEAMLMKLVKSGYLLKFTGDEGDTLLAEGDADLVIEYNGDIAQKAAEDKDLDFVVPKEGSELSSDTLAIPTGAKHPDNAHKFINFILDGKAGAEISKTISYPTPNDAAKALMDDAYKTNHIIFPPADLLAKCEYGQYPGPDRAQKYEEIATRLKAASGH